MKLRNTAIAGMCALPLALAAGACGDDGNTKTTGGVATVSGRLSSGADSQSGSTASLMAVGDDGSLTLAGTAAVTADGRFEIDQAEAGDGPFVVRVEGGGDVVGEVIVPQDLDAGDEVTTAPIDTRTSVAAEALIAITAGSAGTEDVDTVGLMTWVDASLAADAEAGATTAAAIGAAFMAAQEAYLEVAAGQDSSSVSAEQLEGVKLDIQAELAVALDAATTAEAGEDAWTRFHGAAAGQIEAKLGLTSDTQADAVAAAGFLFTASLTGSATAADDAARVAAVLSAHADLVAQRQAAAGSSAQASVQAELEAAYAAFFDAAAAAEDDADMTAAWESLAARVTGSGSLELDSALGLLVAGDASDDAQAMEDVVSAIGATASASASLQAKLAAALEGEAGQRAEAVATAYAEFRAEVGTAIETTLGANSGLSARVQAFAEDAANQIGGHGSVVLDIDISAMLGGFAIGGIDLAGSVVAGLGFQSGADAAFGDADFNALIGATTAVLLSIDGGVTSIVDEGSVGASGWSFDNVGEVSGTLLVELRDASGAVTGAVILDGNTSGDGTVGVPAMTEETTVEALVLLDLVAQGENVEAVDRATLEVLIDAAVAANAESEDDVHTLALAVEAAAALQAEVLNAGAGEMHDAGGAALVELHAELAARGEAAAAAWADFRADLAVAVQAATGASDEVYQQARLESAVVFAAVVEAGAGAESDLAAASEARAHLEAALSLQGATAAAFDGSSFEASEASVALAVLAFVTATHEATNQGELDAAAETFVTAMLGFGAVGSETDGVLGDVVTNLGLGAALQATLDGIIDGTFAAATTFHLAVDGAVRGAMASGTTGADDGIDEDAVATAVTSASGTFAAGLDLSALLWSSADDDALSTLLTHVALGFEGAYQAQ